MYSRPGATTKIKEAKASHSQMVPEQYKLGECKMMQRSSVPRISVEAVSGAEPNSLNGGTKAWALGC